MNLLKKKKSEKEEKILGMEKKHAVLIFSALIGIIIAFTGLLWGDTKLYGIFFGCAILIGFIPYSTIIYSEKKTSRDMEENLPAFLRDMAEAKKTGMTLPQAVYKSSHVDYGKLTPEVQKMANQISWGIPFNDVLSRFAKRSKSRFIERAIAIIVEAQISGGAISDTLDSVARDARMIKESEKERKSMLNQQAMIMYAIFFLFLAIVVALQNLMMPLLQSRGFSLSTEDPAEVLSFYRNLFFSMIVIQAIFNGMLAGQIGEGSPIAGLKHSAIFLVVGIVVSWFLIF